MKKIFKLIAFLAILLMLVGGFFSCGEKERYDIYSLHNISACGVEDPLLNIEWLREFCNTVRLEQYAETQKLSSVYIDIYKVIDTDEHIFEITISLIDGFPESDFRNCNGVTVFHWLNTGVGDPSRYNDFMEDKEFVVKLYHFAKH